MSYLLAERDLEGLEAPAPSPEDAFAPLVAECPAMLDAIARARRLSLRSGPNLLLIGEAGTGKEAFARAIHVGSPRAHAPFLTLDCGAVPVPWLEAELFGHERAGASAASCTKQGLFELAGDGTLFVDHVSRLPLDLQPKLLRALEERRVRRAGGFVEVEVRCRVIAATDAPLEALVEEGALREDLFHRLSLVLVAIPPLRARGEDVLLLARHFLDELEATHSVPLSRLTDDAAAALRTHSWPGNVRELRSVVQRAAVACAGGAIEASALALAARSLADAEGKTAAGGAIRVPLGGRTLESAEAELVRLTLELTSGNKSAAARTLGISRPTLDRKIDQYDIALRTDA
jgi:DNA-binding NtrC family response regulator